MSILNEEKVLTVRHWTDRLFSFVTTRNAPFRFSNGHFTMVGLTDDCRPLLRAYSIASANYEDHLEFLSIKVDDGPQTSRLQHIRPGDTVLVGRKPTGTLLIDYLLPGKNLYLIGTGTGIAPFLSIIRDPETYSRFERVILVHGVRAAKELAYRDLIDDSFRQHELVGEQSISQLLYYPTVTHERFINQGRITHLLENKVIFHDLSMPEFNSMDRPCHVVRQPADVDRSYRLLGTYEFEEGSTSRPGHFVVERAFAEK